jgi:hypothetical protein
LLAVGATVDDDDVVVPRRFDDDDDGVDDDAETGADARRGEILARPESLV